MGKKVTLILRSDFIEDETYWFIRYFRSKNIEPLGILSTVSNKEKYKQILGVPILVIDEMTVENTKNSILIIINRESDRQVFTQRNYRESDYGFCFRARGSLQFVRNRGMENYVHIIQNEEQYYEILEMLEDEESKRSFIEVIRSLLENDIYRYHEYRSEIKYFDDTIYKPLGKDETWINCGSCTGDTILHYLALKREFKRVYAVEVELEKILHLKELFGLFPGEVRDKIAIYNKYLEGYGSDLSIDCVFSKEKISLINMDIEGSEIMVLEGAVKKIKEDRPVLAVAAYHKAEDLLSIPKFVYKQSADYHFYFRKYRGTV